MHGSTKKIMLAALISAAALAVLIPMANFTKARQNQEMPPKQEAQQEQEQEARLIPFQGYDLDGNPLDLGERIGKKAVMLVFWASWCPSCRAEVPKVNDLVKKYGSRGMDFIGVNIGQNDTYKRAKAWAAKAKMQYPTYFDSSGAVSTRYALRGVPTIVVANKKGFIQYYGYRVPDIDEKRFKLLTAD